MKSWLEKNGIEMYSTHNEGKSAVAEIFIRTLKNKLYRYMTSVSKDVHIDKLDDKLINIIIHKFKAGAIVRISKYKNMFAKSYVLNWSE